MAITLVQTAKNQTASTVSSLNVVFGSGISAGSSLVVLVGVVGISVGSPSMSDTGPNVYNIIDTQAIGVGTGIPVVVGHGYIFRADNVAAGATTITFNLGAGSGPITIIAREYSGLASSPADQEISQTQNQQISFSSGNVTTAHAIDLLVGFFMSGTAKTMVAGSGYGNLVTEVNTSATPMTLYMEDHIVSATGTYAATFTCSAPPLDAWIGIMALRDPSTSALNAGTMLMMGV